MSTGWCEPVAIETYVHQLGDHIATALSSGWVLAEMRERLIDETWLALKPKWERYLTSQFHSRWSGNASPTLANNWSCCPARAAAQERRNSD